MRPSDFLSYQHTICPPEPMIRRTVTPAPAALTLLCACGGWGKSTLLCQLQEEQPRSVCLVLTEADNSPRRLVALLSQALPEASIAPEEEDVTALWKAAAALSERKAPLLLDNADKLTSPAAVDLLSLLVRAALEGHCSVVMAARSVPAYLLPAVMEDKVCLWGVPELRFTPEETATLAGKLCPGLSEQEIRQLHAFTGGWCIAGAALLRHYGQELPLAARRSFLPEYVRTQIVSSLGEDIRLCLLQSAFLLGDEDFYREGLYLTDMQSALTWLVKAGIAGERDGVPVYPEVLRVLLWELLPRKEKNELNELAADYYIRHKRFAEAIRLFEASGNAAAAEELLRLYGDKLLANCEFELIGYCGRIIGEPRRVRDADALGALAQYEYYMGNYDNMETLLNRADSMFGKENRFSVLRRLYNGLLRYDRKPELYAGNVCTAVEWLKAHELPLPFLYRREIDVLEKILAGQSRGSSENDSRCLRIHRFGGLHLTAGPEKTEIQCKTKRSAELIAYMLDCGDRPIGRDELLNVFWHTEMPANAVAMLHNMIYHLRRELTPYGLENIITYKNKTYTLDRRLIAEEDSAILQVCEAVRNGNVQALVPHEGLLGNYWGVFLGTIDSPWVNERREYFDRCYINACTLLSQHLRSQGRTEQAALLLRNAYRLDPFSEQLVSELLGAYAAQGKPDKARLCYEEYASRLDAEFGTRPSKWLRNRYFSCLSEREEST